MQTTQGSLVIVGANTSDAKVFWNGQSVANLGFSISFEGKVVLRVAEDPLLAEMQAAGIIIRRVPV